MNLNTPNPHFSANSSPSTPPRVAAPQAASSHEGWIRVAPNTVNPAYARFAVRSQRAASSFSGDQHD